MNSDTIPEVTIVRYYNGLTATHGQAVCRNGAGAILFLQTLELPWNDNKSNRSCIPLGTYRATRYKSPRFGETYLLAAVPNRGGILFHAGNTVNEDPSKPGDSRGCILLGTTSSNVNMLQSSRIAVQSFMRHFASDSLLNIHIRRIP
jgi:hypothetical protein